MWRKSSLLFSLIFVSLSSFCQTKLTRGFDAQEYVQLIEIYHQQGLAAYQEFYARDSARDNIQQTAIPFPENYKLLYRSPETQLFNSWELWLSKDSIAVVSIRGTVMKTSSWLENFYAAMVPAKGVIQLNDSTKFDYKLADDDRAAVHAGWLIGMASMAPDIVQHIRELYNKGIHDFIITGHSQGGAISFLLSSYLHYLPANILPNNIHYKVYCSAAPKPGNLYYAYDFDHIFSGWAFHVVSTEDWVPQTPFTTQTLTDFNTANPFLNINQVLKKQPWLVRIYLRHAYNKYNRSLNKAANTQIRYLGKTIFRQVQRSMPELRQPVYARSMNYVSAGTPIILSPYPGYEKQFVFDGKNVFIHHGLVAYYDLAEHDFLNASK